MSWGVSASFPRAILHIDGDAFFASCEVAKDPSLRGKAVITGKERGIVSACTYEAKSRGVKRGMQLHKVRSMCPDAVILPSDYETYSLFSMRMYEVVRRYTSAVEEYSIDECFADLSGMRRVNKMSYPAMAAAIQVDLERELGMSFSIGLSATKTLAKIGSKWKKPHGLTVIPLSEREKYLRDLSAGSVWGIGPNTAAYLLTFGVRTALQFARREAGWVREKLSKPFFEIWRELNGEVALELDTEGRKSYQSISKTKTFTPPSSDSAFVFAQLSKNVENACIKARRWNLSTPHIFFFLKTQEFKYRGVEITLPHPTSVPQDILKEVRAYFPQAWKRGERYRATGVVLTRLQDGAASQLDLFGAVEKSEGWKRVFDSVDEMSEKYGKHAVYLGSSLLAVSFGAHLSERGDKARRTEVLFKGETARRRLNLPMLGEVQ